MPEGRSMNKFFSNSQPGFPDTEPMSQPMKYAGDTSFAATQPSPLRALPDEPDFGSLSLAPAEVTLYEALAEIRKDNRVCPLPTRWLEFYRLLQESGDGTPLPPQPLTGSAWAATPSLAKRMCFREQVEWADRHRCLRQAYEFIESLPDNDWHYD